MRHTSRLACAALALAVCLPLHSSELQRPEPGFGGLKWGDPPAKEMVLVSGRADAEAFYTRPGEPARVFGVDAGEVRYAFWKGRLTMVGIHGSRNFGALLNALSESWGPGFQADTTVRRYTWASGGPDGRTIAGLDLENAGGFFLAIFSEDLTDAVEVERAARGSRTAP